MLRDSQLFRRLQYAWRFPQLLVSAKAALEIDGEFSYGKHARVNEGAKIIVSGTGRLSIDDEVYVGRHVEIATESDMRIGRDTSIQDYSVLVGNLHIGAYCLFSYGVMATSGSHIFDRWPHLLIRDQDDASVSDDVSKPILVGDDCWIGAHSVLMAGVRIGKGAVIGAGTIVTRDVHPYTVVVGAPGRNVRNRLEFRPPTRLKADDSRCWPYFYSGFYLRTPEIRESLQSLGGLVAQHRMSFALDNRRGATALVLEVRSIADEVEISLDGCSYQVGTDYTRIAFPVSGDEMSYTYFELRSQRTPAKIVVREACLE